MQQRMQTRHRPLRQVGQERSRHPCNPIRYEQDGSSATHQINRGSCRGGREDHQEILFQAVGEQSLLPGPSDIEGIRRMFEVQPHARGHEQSGRVDASGRRTDVCKGKEIFRRPRFT